MRRFATILLLALFTLALSTKQAQAQWGGFPVEWGKVMKVVDIPDGKGGFVKTLRITGANLQIVNGAGTTGTTNGTGNLIVGYNELGNPNGDDRTGSHNIAFGEANSFSSFGGLVGPKDSTISAPFASVSGGRDNIARGRGLAVAAGGGRADQCAEESAQ